MAPPRPSLSSRLRDRITIRRRSDVPDGKGGFVPGWTTLAERLPAEVVNQSGREAVIASALQGVSAYRIVVRQRSDLRVSDQVLYRPYRAAAELELNIRSFGEDPFLRRAATVIYADTEAPQGA